MGKAWVGDGYTTAKGGEILISADGLRQFRYPSYKPQLGKTQANFQGKLPGLNIKEWQTNGHLDIIN